MSDYRHEKVIRLPFPKSILEKCNTDDPWDCEDYLREKLGDLWSANLINKNDFNLGYTDSAFYIDWLYHCTYGEESSEWGRSRLLTVKELNVIRPLFDKLDVSYNDKDLRAVDYCYYNSCEPKDCYEVTSIDDSHLLIN